MEITSLIVKYVYKVFISNSIYVTEDRQSEWQERAPAVSNLTTFHNVQYWRDSPLQRPLVFKLL